MENEKTKVIAIMIIEFLPILSYSKLKIVLISYLIIIIKFNKNISNLLELKIKNNSISKI